ncbi:MAG: hypothetical protein M0P31_15315 [Solirubrobacteraceae bacterium]|nr:hypothetical protein [Solirubrobacteraceae bacterium]
MLERLRSATIAAFAVGVSVVLTLPTAAGAARPATPTENVNIAVSLSVPTRCISATVSTVAGPDTWAVAYDHCSSSRGKDRILKLGRLGEWTAQITREMLGNCRFESPRLEIGVDLGLCVDTAPRLLRKRLEVDIEDTFGSSFTNARFRYVKCPHDAAGPGSDDAHVQMCEYVFGTGQSRTWGSATIEVSDQAEVDIDHEVHSRRSTKLRTCGTRDANRTAGTGNRAWRVTRVRASRNLPGCRGAALMIGDVLYPNRGRRVLPSRLRTASHGTGTAWWPEVYRWSCRRTGRTTQTVKCSNRVGYRYEWRVRRR